MLSQTICGRGPVKIKLQFSFYLYIFTQISALGHSGVHLGGRRLPRSQMFNIKGYRVCVCVCVPAYRSAVCDNEMPHVAKRYLEGEQGCFSLGSCFTECTFSSFCLETQKHDDRSSSKRHTVYHYQETPRPSAWWITVCHRDEKFHLHEHSLPITKTDTVQSHEKQPPVLKHNNHQQEI